MRSVRYSPKVFVVVLNWNGWQDTLRCLASLDELDYGNYSVLVVDNASTDDSEARIRSSRPDVEFIQSGENRGYAGGHNIGIRYALDHGADYVWVLNNDIVVRPEALTASVAVAEADPKVGIVGSSQFQSLEPWQDAELYITAARHAGRRDVMVSCPGHKDPSGYSHHRVSFVSGGALLLRSEMLRQVGAFDERYFHYAEEVDLNERASAAGWHIVLACNSHIWHARGKSLPAQSPQALYYRARNHLLMRRKLAGRRVWKTLLREPRFTYEFVMKPFTRLARGDWAAPLAVLFGVIDAARQRTGRRDLGKRFEACQ